MKTLLLKGLWVYLIQFKASNRFKKIRLLA
jgi:hypothetical protein